MIISKLIWGLVNNAYECPNSYFFLSLVLAKMPYVADETAEHRGKGPSLGQLRLKLMDAYILGTSEVKSLKIDAIWKLIKASTLLGESKHTFVSDIIPII